jgi:hypothetical protein
MAAYAGPWNFHERRDRNGVVITVWISSSRLSKKAQARLERALDQLRHMPKTSWSKPAPASNIGDHTYVIRFKDESGMQHRVFGHFYDPHLVFVLTFSGYEKDDVYYPSNYQDVAQRHRLACEADFHAHTVKFRHYCALCKPEGSKAKPS